MADELFETRRDRLLAAAALRASFAPRALFDATFAGEDLSPLERLELMSALSVASDTTGPRWHLLPASRGHAVTRGADPRTADTDIADAIRGDGVFVETELTRMTDDPDASPEALQAVLSALERAGPMAKTPEAVMPLRAALDRAQQTARSQRILARGFFGRTDELARLDRLLETTQRRPPLSVIYLTGAPGVGKSYLLEEVLRREQASRARIVVRLDFDRSILRAGQSGALYDEIARQIATSLPHQAEALRDIRLDMAEFRGLHASTESGDRAFLQLGRMVEIVARARRPLLVVLDTLEALVAGGPYHLDTLLRGLDRLVAGDKQALEVVVLAAGRGPDWPGDPDRLRAQLHLEGLDDAAARGLLDGQGVAADQVAAVLAVAGGNPLRLRLATHAVQSGVTLEELSAPDGDVSAGYLTRAILSRMPDRLALVAEAALVLTRIEPDDLTQVLAPALELRLSNREAAEIFDQLSRLGWLFARHGDVLTPRPALRPRLLAGIYARRPDLAARINRRARDHLAESDPVLALYHDLQATPVDLSGAADPDRFLARQMPERLISELPLDAANLLRSARGEQTRTASPDPSSEPASAGSIGAADLAPDPVPPEMAAAPDNAAAAEEAAPGGSGSADAPDARPMIIVTEGRFLAHLDLEETRQPAFAPGPFTLSNLRLFLMDGDPGSGDLMVLKDVLGAIAPDSPAGHLLLAHAWKGGQWTLARKIADLLPDAALPRTLTESPELSGRAMLEIWAQTRFDTLVRTLSHPQAFEIVEEVMERSAGFGLPGSALDFALLCLPHARPESRTETALAALVPSLPGIATDWAVLEQSRAADLRAGLGLSQLFETQAPSIGIPSEAARAIAPLNPYATPIRTLIRRQETAETGRLNPDLFAFRRRLFEMSDLFAPMIAGAEGLDVRLSVRPLNLFEGIVALGLLAEWAEGYGFYHPQPDFSRLAKAAGDWHRAASGLWCYGKATPDNWAGRSGSDHSSRALVKSLLSSRDPVARARRALLFWADPQGRNPGAGQAQLRRRAARRYETARDTGGSAEDILAGFQTSGLPGVIAAPLAVLAAEGLPFERIATARTTATPSKGLDPSALAPPPDLDRSASDAPARRPAPFEPAPDRRPLMTNPETFTRLETLGNDGAIDRARDLLERHPDLLSSMGFKLENAREIVATDMTRLESLGHAPSALEAIVRAVGRPPLIVRGKKVEGKQSLGGDFPAAVDTMIAQVEPMLTSVGRIEFVNHDMAWGGTGWVIAEGDDHYLVATNRHVAKIVARRTFRGDGVFLFAPGAARYGARIDFVEEAGTQPGGDATFKLEKFTYIAEDAAADVALARMAKPADGAHRVSPLDLAETDGEDKETVATVGYPAADGLRNDRTEMENYFKGLYDVKRFAPGFLIDNGTAEILRHDCTTLGGNSGSPLISLDRAKVVGLHYAGRYGVGNSAVRASTLRALLDGASTGLTGFASGSAAERPDGQHAADAFPGREGYDPDFLQVAPVPLPQVPDHYGLSRPSDATDARPHELRYTNFGILYSGTLKTPILAALNLDGSRSRPQKRGSDKWFADLRLPAEVQLGKEDFDSPAIDRGHLIRRAATNWGDTEEQARQADADSFHYTCAAPQHKAFNRSNAQWLGLENYILTSARTHGFKACVFTGPVIDGSEPELKDTGSPIPLKFFKVVVMLAEEPGSEGIIRRHATAYLLSQVEVIQQLLEQEGYQEAVEGFEFGAFRTYQTRISEIETLTGLDFGALKEADPLARAIAETESMGPAPRPIVEIDDLEAIVL